MAKNRSDFTAPRRLLSDFVGPVYGGLLLVLIIFAVAWFWAPGPPTYTSFQATRFDILPLGREELSALPDSVRWLLMNPDTPEFPVSDFDEAVRRAGFVPRLPQSNGLEHALSSPKLSVVEPMYTDAAIRTGQLQAALMKSQARNLNVPRSWDGVILELRISAGIVADYGGFRVGQRLPLEFRAPDNFPVDRLLEMLFRIGGLNAADASALAKRFHERPAEFLLVPAGHRIDAREVQLASGTGVLLRYGSDDGVERLSLAWKTPNRAYFLTGALAEAQATEIANSLK